VEHPLLLDYSTDGYVRTLEQLILDYEPHLVLISATPYGQDFAPRLAARLRASIVTGCVSVKLNRQGDLQFVKPIYNDKVYSTILCASKPPFFATIRPGVIGVEPPGRTSQPEVITRVPDLSEEMLRTRSVKFIPGDPKRVDLREAERIVAGGQGVNKESWCLVTEAAERLGASVGGTRMAVDKGYCGNHRMIGQTGKRVKPKFYLAVGISGSEYHLRGVDTECLIAVNHDKNAPIFDRCNLGVVGDLRQILKALFARLKQK
jgi:electron transfer flavoprotein alpha subunit